MNKPFLLTAAVVLAAGAVVFLQQTRRLKTVRQTAAPRAATASAPAVARTWESPPVMRPTPKGLLLDKLAERLISSLTPERTTVFLELADHMELHAIIANAGLTEEERAIFEDKFAALRKERAEMILKKDLSSAGRESAFEKFDTAKQDWIASRLGAERLAKVDAAQQAATRAAAERDTTRAVSRISRAADLTAEQKDRLHSTLLDRALHPLPTPAAADEKLQFRTSGTLTEVPDAPSLAEEARAILTPEQWAVYEQGASFPMRQQAAMIATMQEMIPAMIATVQELVDQPAEQ